MTILLYGFLGKKFGRVHRYNVSCPAEAISALSNTLEGFKTAVIEGGYYKVLRGGKDIIQDTEFMFPQSEKETLRIVPVPSGAGGDFFGIVFGAILIATGQIWALELGATMAGIVTGIGVSMVMGGISSLLFSPPDVKTDQRDRPENRPSYSFNGPVNTVAQGNPVPLCYGKLLVGSQVVSAGLSAQEIPVS